MFLGIKEGRKERERETATHTVGSGKGRVVFVFEDVFFIRARFYPRLAGWHWSAYKEGGFPKTFTLNFEQLHSSGPFTYVYMPYALLCVRKNKLVFRSSGDAERGGGRVGVGGGGRNTAD